MQSPTLHLNTTFETQLYWNNINITESSVAMGTMASYHIPSIIFSLIFFITIAFSATTMTTTRIPSTRFTKVFAFGDSYTDTGNTRSETGPNGFGHVSNYPYGSTFFHHPTNRYSDGRLVIDFITEYLSLPYLPPYKNPRADTSHGVNFAVAGATAINYSFFVRNNLTLDTTAQSIQTQLTWFKKFSQSHGCQKSNSKECKDIMDNSLFWVGEIGVNDNAYIIGSSVSRNLIRMLALGSVTRFLQGLLSMGAKHIVVQGTPLSGCLPLAMTLAPTDDRDDMGCVATANNQTYYYNKLLQVRLQALRRQYPEAVIAYTDFWHAERSVMKNLQKYKFKEPFKACCGTGGGLYNFQYFASCGSKEVQRACAHPAQFINWDGVHLTEAMYKVLADMFLHGGYTHPPLDLMLNSTKHDSST